jgi:hypothetical protein
MNPNYWKRFQLQVLLLHTHLSLPSEAHISPAQLPYHYILSLYVGDFIFDLALHWIESEEVSQYVSNVRFTPPQVVILTEQFKVLHCTLQKRVQEYVYIIRNQHSAITSKCTYRLNKGTSATAVTDTTLHVVLLILTHGHSERLNSKFPTHYFSSGSLSLWVWHDCVAMKHIVWRKQVISSLKHSGNYTYHLL